MFLVHVVAFHVLDFSFLFLLKVVTYIAFPGLVGMVFSSSVTFAFFFFLTKQDSSNIVVVFTSKTVLEYKTRFWVVFRKQFWNKFPISVLFSIF